MRAAVILAVAVGLISALAGIAVAVVAFEPIPFADFIDFYRRFFEVGGWSGYGFAELYERHNEHRLLVPRLWFLADLWLFAGTQWFLIVVIVLSSVAHAGVLSWLFSSLGHRSALGWVFAALALGAVLSPAQWENLVWGFQVQFIQVWLFATLAFVAIAANNSMRPWGRVVVAALFGLASTYSMANGLLVWPLLVGLAFWCGLRGWPLRVLIAVALGVIAIEVAGYRSHPGHGDPLQTLRQPLALAQYALRYLTTGIGQIGTLGQEILGAVFVVTIGAITVDAIRHRDRYRPAHAVLLAVAGFVIGAALLTALGRVTFGVGQANSVRYATPSFLFLLATLALLLDRLASADRRRMRTAGITVAAVLLLVPGLVDGVRHLPTIIGARDARTTAVTAYLAGGFRPETLTALYPFWPIIPMTVLQQLDQAGLGPFADRARFMPPRSLLQDPGPEPSEICRGNVESVVSNPVDGVAFTGWAAALSSSEQPMWLLVTDSSGKVVGWGGHQIERIDVGKGLGIGRLGRGFIAVGPQPVAGPVDVVGVFSDGSLCRVASALPAEPPRFLTELPGAAVPASEETWSIVEGERPDRVGPVQPPERAHPVIGTLGVGSHLLARLDVSGRSGTMALAVPVRTGPYPLNVSVLVRDLQTGNEIERYAFGRPSGPRWVWLVFRQLADERFAGHRLQVEIAAAGPYPWQGVAVGRPHWISAIDRR